jgi:signal transduction histidine kinase/DNA-binding LacI/PurR family transcriptional regulator/putative methionine-R-sulfoxide reductase with GAF domain
MKETKRKKSRGRPTIGYLAPWIGSGYRTLWIGIHDAACKYDINLICFPGGRLWQPHQFKQRSVIYDLITSHGLDGLILRSEALSAHIFPEEFETLYERFRPLPMVSVAKALPGIPSILVDNTEGIHSIITHLVETHGYHRIGFIRGPENHQEAEQRYHTYTEGLDKYGLTLDPNLIVAGDFTESAGAEAVRVLLDQRKLLPGKDFEAIIAANDTMALSMLDALQARGVRVPADVVLVGFDDKVDSQYTIPPLTTVRNPFRRIGMQAVEMLLAQIKGQSAPEVTTLPLDLIVRQSCGCPLSSALQATTEPMPHESSQEGNSKLSLSSQRKNILSALTHSIDISTNVKWAEQLLDAYIAEVKEKDGPFLATSEEILRKVAISSADAFAWQRVLSTLGCHTFPYLGDNDRPRAKAVLDQARILVGDITYRLEGRRAILATRQAQTLHQINFGLITHFDLTELLNVIAQRMPATGILDCYLSLFEDPQKPTEQSRLILALNEGKRVDLEPEGRLFSSCQLIPDGILPPNRRHSLVLEPLYYHDSLLGFVLLEAQPTLGDAFEVLQRQISSSLQGVLLLQARRKAEEDLEKAYAEVEKQVQERTAELKKEIVERKRAEEALKHRLEQLAALSQASQAVTAFLEPDQVLAEIVSLANGVVDSDYTSVILVDETGKIRQSAENLPGVQALQYRIRDGGLTHWIVRLRRTVVIDEIKEDSTVYPSLGDGAPTRVNPLLIEANIKSLAGLPLMVKNRLLGVLYLHSLRPNAFGGQLFLLSAFANQVAIAIENARLFQAEQRQTQRLALLAEIARTAATTFDADALLQAVAESIFHHFNYPRVGLFILDEEGQTLTLRGRSTKTVTLNELAKPGHYRLGIEQGITGHVARTGQSHLAVDVSTDPYFVNITQVPTQSALGVPILEEDATIGTIIVESDERAAFDEEDQALLEAVADTVAVGLRNARLYQETQRRVQELVFLNSITIGPGAALDMSSLINKTLDGLHSLIACDLAGFVTISQETGSWEMTHERVVSGVESSIGLSGALVEESIEPATSLDNQPPTILDATDDPQSKIIRETYRSRGIRSLILMPLRVGGRLYGTIGIGHCSEKHTWHPDDIRLLEAVVHQLRLVIENAHLFEEAQRRTEELAAALVQLEEMDCLKDEFIQNVSHELRSPLALIRGYAEMLDSGELGEVPSEQRKPVAIIARRARMLGDLVKDITLILEAEVSSPDPEPIQLDELVRNAVEDFQVEIKQADLILLAESEPNLPPVSGAYTYLRRVLDNLIGNAVKFTPANGTITVRLRREGDMVALEVSDTGVGIPEDKLERVFERFYQVDGSARRRYGGVGLGLALVKEIVEAYGGHVTVESELDKGSTFTAYMPIFSARTSDLEFRQSKKRRADARMSKAL